MSGAILLAAVLAALACDPQNPPGPFGIVNPNVGVPLEAGDAGCGQGMVLVRSDGGRSFCIDRFGGSLVEIEASGAERPWSPYHNPGDRDVRAVVLAHGLPQGYMSGAQSERACERAGKRLCSDDEFLRACEGSRGWTYPYAPTRYPTGTSPSDPACNESRSQHPALELFPDDPHPFDHLKNACIDQLDHTVARGGAFGKCVSEDGVYDLMGNLHEWVGAPDPQTGKGRFRGGYFMDTHVNGEGCRYVTHAHKFTYWDYSTGFRCCADPAAAKP